MLTKIDINLEKIRLWLVIVLIQAGSFGMGMYTAHTYWIPKSQPSSTINYTTNRDQSKNSELPPKDTSTPNTSSSQNSDYLDPDNCTAIKGNISGTSKTYHVPGGSFYDRTTPEMCFSDEEEAKSAGFSKSSR